MSNAALSAPPVLAIASEPLASSCRQDSAGQLEGPALVRVPSKPDQAGTLYQSAMQTADWSGSFIRYAMAPGTGGLSQAKQSVWDAGALLTGSAIRAASPPPERRNLHTAIVQADGTLVMVPFAWEALSPEQRAQLDPASDGSGPQRLAWLRGERSREGALFRTRNSILGNSVHSTPVYVGQPSQALAPARPDMLYLGANDGMLHAFNAADGTELFAYVPAALFGALHRLADKDYVHRAYVDGPAQAADVMIAGSTHTVLVSGMGGGAQGVFALDITDPARFSEQGGVLWEFTDRHDPNIGNVTSAPQLAKLRVGTYGGAPVYRYFAVVASGLNNYAADGNHSPSGDGALFLLALDKPRNAPWRLNDNYYRLRTPIADATLPNALHAPALVNDRQGAARYAYAGDLQGNLWRFDLTAGPLLSLAGQAGQAARTGQTGQAAQTVLTGHTGQVAQTVWMRQTGQVAQTVRTGQMGQVIQTVRTGQMGQMGQMAQIVQTVQTGQAQPLADNASLSPLFVARDASGRRQPIAQQPQVAYANDGGYFLLFGTGKLIEQADRDPARFAPQTYYAIRDSLRTPPELVTGRRQLTRRELKGDPASERLAIEGEAMAPDSMGWYMDLLASSTTGERSLDSGVLVNGALAFNTVLPTNEGGQPGQPGQSGQPGTPATPATPGTPTTPATPTTPGNPGASCSPAHSRTYVLNVLTGLALGQSVTARLPPTPEAPPPVVAERTTRYVPRPLLLPVPPIKPIAPREPTGRVNLTQDFAIGAPAPHGEQVVGTVNTRKRAGRLSWREVANWRQLHQAYQEPQANQANPANPAKQADYAKQAHQVYRVNQAHQADRAVP